jgi:antitoxin FitA
LHNAGDAGTMQAVGVNITIRDVPEDVRNILAGRAAREGRSMQEHLRAHLIQLASGPTNEEIIDRARARVRLAERHPSDDEIVEAVRADRR